MTTELLQEGNYKVSGMTCASCAMSIESYLKVLEGVHSVSVNYPNQSVYVSFDESLISLQSISLKTKEIGFDLLIDDQDQFDVLEGERLSSLQRKLVVSAIFSLPIFLMSMFFMGKVPYENWVMLVLSLPVLGWSGAEFYVNAWNRLKNLSSNMDTLVALSTSVAFGFSVFNTVYPDYFMSKGVMPHVYYESAVIIITLILLGRFLEERAKKKTTGAIKKLMGLQEKEVCVLRNGVELDIDINEVLKGDLVVVKPGNRIPIDGKVKKGSSFVDESMISGESLPIEKNKGDEVFAGTVNQKGSLRILVTKIGQETLLSRIIHQVEMAQATKPKIQKKVDAIASVFVPIVLGIAIVTFSVWYFLGPEPTFSRALVAFVTVLIIACPCALGLATPTALMVGIGKGAEHGILIKDAQTLELAYKIDALILDKTGTITEGKPKVVDSYLNEVSDTQMSVIYAIEKQSEHPIAEAVVQYCQNQELSSISVEKFESITGKGTRAFFEDQEFLLGNLRLMMDENVIVDEPFQLKIKEFQQNGNTIVCVSQNKKMIALFGVRDQVKKTSIEAIQKIKKLGIEVYMLTGDNESAAAIIAKKVGVEHYKSEVLPQDKGAFVVDLQNKGKVVAMVGDGINDSQALAQANVGIAMGSGTDIAMESAGITLMHSDLKQVSKAIELSKETLKTINQNLFWAFVYNIVAIPVAAGVFFPINGFLLNPMIAGAAMSLSSISVLSNSLRLKRKEII